jgi:alcohol dehydrogenase class IV
MAVTRWAFPTAVLFGSGAVNETGRKLVEMAVKRALICTDAGVKKAGLLEPVAAALAGAGIAHAVYDGVMGNPLEEHVEAGIDAYRAHGAEAIVAVGGGSSIDVAKLIALRVNHHRPLADYDDAKGGDALVTEAVPPIIAIPTTAGTGSEVGRSGVVTLRATGRKTVIFSSKLMPRVAILDPEMTRSMPPFITAATGYDALTHCVEAYVSKGDHPMCDAIALGGIRLVGRSLRRAVSHGDDLEARGDMLKAAMMGAVAFQKGLGACHSLAHPLSSVCGLHHGLANALCLPGVVPFNLDAGGDIRERYAMIARELTGSSSTDCAAALAELRSAIGLPDGLKSAGVMEEQLDRLADEAFLDACHTLNPRACTRDDLLGLYRASW